MKYPMSPRIYNQFNHEKSLIECYPLGASFIYTEEMQEDVVFYGVDSDKYNIEDITIEPHKFYTHGVIHDDKGDLKYLVLYIDGKTIDPSKQYTAKAKIASAASRFMTKLSFKSTTKIASSLDSVSVKANRKNREEKSLMLWERIIRGKFSGNLHIYSFVDTSELYDGKIMPSRIVLSDVKDELPVWISAVFGGMAMFQNAKVFEAALEVLSGISDDLMTQMRDIFVRFIESNGQKIVFSDNKFESYHIRVKLEVELRDSGIDFEEKLQEICQGKHLSALDKFKLAYFFLAISKSGALGSHIEATHSELIDNGIDPRDSNRENTIFYSLGRRMFNRLSEDGNKYMEELCPDTQRVGDMLNTVLQYGACSGQITDNMSYLPCLENYWTRKVAK